MFRVGQKVRLTEKAKESDFKYFSGKDCILVIRDHDDRIYTLSIEDKIKCDNVFAYANELLAVYPICPVCNQEVEVNNNKIKVHNYNNELCYGSYTPCSE